jgi:hypothetical protein
MAKYVTKKRVIVVAVAALAIGLGTSAFAYFTSTGSGTGTATVGTSSVVQLSSLSVGPLYPGGADVPVTVSVHNPGGGNQYVNQITGTVATNGGCLTSWFVVDPINYAAEVAPGVTSSASTNVRMLNVAANQDACKNASMTINWSSN